MRHGAFIARTRDHSHVELLLRDPVRAPRFLVDCSTVSAEASAHVRELAAARGTTFLAAPVSGNGRVVRAGLLTLVVSGPRDAFTELAPLLGLLGQAEREGPGAGPALLCDLLRGGGHFATCPCWL